MNDCAPHDITHRAGVGDHTNIVGGGGTAAREREGGLATTPKCDYSKEKRGFDRESNCWVTEFAFGSVCVCVCVSGERCATVCEFWAHSPHNIMYDVTLVIISNGQVMMMMTMTMPIIPI